MASIIPDYMPTTQLDRADIARLLEKGFLFLVSLEGKVTGVIRLVEHDTDDRRDE